LRIDLIFASRDRGARRLHHCRDLGEPEPFDFVTLFDYSETDARAFDEMLAELRASEEWKYVEQGCSSNHLAP